MQPQGMTFKYKILVTHDWEETETKTAELLNQGYQLVGAPTPYDDPVHGKEIVQCMILPEIDMAQQPTPASELSEEDQAKMDAEITQRINDNLAPYTKDLADINDLRIVAENQQIVLYRKTKNLGAISGSLLVSEIKHGKHAPNDLDESKVLNELDDAIVKGLGVASNENN
ncbi:MAG: hypothetical protein NC218_03680 [Acetobacter sp.]|nr:hypothetical protein [Acetobacter sp.]